MQACIKRVTMAYSWLLLVVYLAMIASAVGRLCQTIEGQFTFFNPGIKDFILCPNERAACSTVGGKKAQRSCEFCCDNNRTKTQKNEVTTKPVTLDKEKSSTNIPPQRQSLNTTLTSKDNWSRKRQVITTKDTNRPFHENDARVNGNKRQASNDHTGPGDIVGWAILAIAFISLATIYGVFACKRMKSVGIKESSPVQETAGGANANNSSRLQTETFKQSSTV